MAAEAGMQVVWDICHFGLPDHVDALAPDFPARFANDDSLIIGGPRAAAER